MRRQFLFLVILFIPFYSSGQFSFGVKSGININAAAHKDIPANFQSFETKMSLGFHIGIFAQIRTIKKFSLTSEFQFIQRGFNSGEHKGPLSPPYDIRLNLNYLELPILLSYSLVKRLTLDLGPSVSYKISAVARGGGSGADMDSLYEPKFDFGITMGARFNLTERILIISRYYYGLTPFVEFHLRDHTTIEYHNSNLLFGLGYKLK